MTRLTVWTEEWETEVRRLYVEERMSVFDVSLEVGSSTVTVRKYLRRESLTRSPHEPGRTVYANGSGPRVAAEPSAGGAVHAAYAGARGAHRRRGRKT